MELIHRPEVVLRELDRLVLRRQPGPATFQRIAEHLQQADALFLGRQRPGDRLQGSAGLGEGGHLRVLADQTVAVAAGAAGKRE